MVMTADSKKKVLIFIVAYNAEKTVESVLSRIPVKDLPPGTEVLVIDDCSTDKTFEMASASRELLDGLKLIILYNPENQGYGGNQKIGYQFAINNKFDVVALLHGDGQYAPEKLPELIQPVISGEAVGTSSRTEKRNALVQVPREPDFDDFSEFDTGYASYRVSFGISDLFRSCT
jgi:glycosyltransferase involved in cell wall biosynthesis